MKVLSLMMGPPREPPPWLRTNVSLIPARLEKKSLAASAWMRLYQKAEPCQVLVPDLSTVSLMKPPPLPYSALKLLVMMRYSWMASGEKEVMAPAALAEVPCAPRPPWPWSLLSKPSSRKLPVPPRAPFTDAPRVLPPCALGTTPAPRLMKVFVLRS